MKTNIYVNSGKFLAGITLKDENEADKHNMAFYASEKPDQVLENRRKLAAYLKCGLGEFVCTQQTHGANFHKVTSEDKGRGAQRTDDAIADTDALYTSEPNLLLCSFTADCVPVMFYDDVQGLVGVIHSGWQGTVKEISLKLFEHLKKEEHCSPEHLHVQIGMALSQEKFEVDEDVYAKFKALGYADDFMYYKEQTRKYYIDNQQTVKKQCELAGIPAENITIDQTCTYKNAAGFSHRQDKKSGRHLAFVMKKPS